MADCGAEVACWSEYDIWDGEDRGIFHINFLYKASYYLNCIFMENEKENITGRFKLKGIKGKTKRYLKNKRLLPNFETLLVYKLGRASGLGDIKRYPS